MSRYHIVNEHQFNFFTGKPVATRKRISEDVLNRLVDANKRDLKARKKAEEAKKAAENAAENLALVKESLKRHRPGSVEKVPSIPGSKNNISRTYLGKRKRAGSMGGGRRNRNRKLSRRQKRN